MKLCHPHRWGTSDLKSVKNTSKIRNAKRVCVLAFSECVYVSFFGTWYGVESHLKVSNSLFLKGYANPFIYKNLALEFYAFIFVLWLLYFVEFLKMCPWKLSVQNGLFVSPSIWDAEHIWFLGVSQYTCLYWK